MYEATLYADNTAATNLAAPMAYIIGTLAIYDDRETFFFDGATSKLTVTENGATWSSSYVFTSSNYAMVSQLDLHNAVRAAQAARDILPNGVYTQYFAAGVVVLKGTYAGFPFYFTDAVAQPLSTPTGLYADNITSDSARVSWTAVENASGYKVEYRRQGDTTWNE